MKFTILGSSGFIGSNLLKYFKENSIKCFCPDRDYKFNKEENLGHVIYCIGLTSDFRIKPFQTIDAHVCNLKNVLLNTSFDSFLYLSSTRVYNGCSNGFENSDLIVNPNNHSDLYNISKLMGESACLSMKNRNVRIVRLSNVIGNDFKSGNFIFTLIQEAVNYGKITLRQSLEVKRDYIVIKDVIELIENIALNGKERLYNISSGINISNNELLNHISAITKCDVITEDSSPNLFFPVIDNKKIKEEFSFQCSSILIELKKLIKTYQNNYRNDPN